MAPAEVEAVLEAHPAVAEALVRGRPDAEWGEAVEAVVVVREGRRVSEAELQEWCGERLARFKVPKSVRWSPSLVRTQSGKLVRSATSAGSEG